MSRLDPVRARQLYDAGLPDTILAESLGVSRPTVRVWRRRNDLAPHFRPGKSYRQTRLGGHRNRSWTFDEDAALKLYQWGLSDLAIGEKIGVSDDAIQRMRKRRGLPANYRGARQCEPVRPYGNSVYAAAAKAVPSSLAPDVRDDAISEIVAAVLSGELAEADIPAKSRRYVNRTIGMFASRWGPSSLDEEIGDDGFCRGDLIPDDRAEADMRLLDLMLLAERMGIDAQAVLAA